MTGWIELGVLAVVLALDAAAVSASLGAAATRTRSLAAAAVVFGLFQAGMSGVGALGGTWLATWAAAWDHWIAFGLLVVVGARMILSAGGGEENERDALPVGVLLGLAVATSIDALAAGVSLPMLGPHVGVSVVAIGAVTALLSAASAAAGRWVGARLGKPIERLGGVALILIGVRIVWEHLGLPPYG